MYVCNVCIGITASRLESKNNKSDVGQVNNCRCWWLLEACDK